MLKENQNAKVTANKTEIQVMARQTRETGTFSIS